jgi:LPXTG-site transpeptidase (sortase) family protein
MNWRALAAVSLAATIGFLVSTPTNDGEPDPRSSAVVIQSTQERGLSAPGAVIQPSNPMTEALLPQGMRIPKLGINAVVHAVGMADATTMEIPEDISVVGWFRYGALPGSAEGNSVYVGHRDGTSDPNGVFRNLRELVPGDVIVVQDTADTEWSYVVSDVELLGKSQFAASAASIFVTDGPSRLVLITCGGDYLESRGGYQANVLVTANPV